MTGQNSPKWSVQKWSVPLSFFLLIILHGSGGSRIFPGGAPTPKIAIIFHIFAENCMKMKEFGSPGGARVPGAPLRSANAWLPANMRNKMFKNLLAISIVHHPNIMLTRDQ